MQIRHTPYQHNSTNLFRARYGKSGCGALINQTNNRIKCSVGNYYSQTGNHLKSDQCEKLVHAGCVCTQQVPKLSIFEVINHKTHNVPQHSKYCYSFNGNKPSIAPNSSQYPHLPPPPLVVSPVPSPSSITSPCSTTLLR